MVKQQNKHRKSPTNKKDLNKNIIKNVNNNENKNENKKLIEPFIPKFSEMSIKTFLNKMTYGNLLLVIDIITAYIQKTDPEYFKYDAEIFIFNHSLYDAFRMNTMDEFIPYKKNELLDVRKSYQLNLDIYSSLLNKSPTLLCYYLGSVFNHCFNSNKNSKNYIPMTKFLVKVNQTSEYNLDGDIIEHTTTTKKYLINYVLDLIAKIDPGIVNFEIFVKIYYDILNMPYYNVLDPYDNNYHENTLKLLLKNHKNIKDDFNEEPFNRYMKLDYIFMEACGMNNIMKFKKSIELINMFIFWLFNDYNNFINNGENCNKNIGNKNITISDYNQTLIDYFNSFPYFDNFIKLIEVHLCELFVLATFVGKIKILNIIHNSDICFDLQLMDSPMFFIMLNFLSSRVIINTLIKFNSLDREMTHIMIVNLIKVSILDNRFEQKIKYIFREQNFINEFNNQFSIGEISPDLFAKKLIQSIPEYQPYFK